MPRLPSTFYESCCEGGGESRGGVAWIFEDLTTFFLVLCRGVESLGGRGVCLSFFLSVRRFGILTSFFWSRCLSTFYPFLPMRHPQRLCCIISATESFANCAIGAHPSWPHCCRFRAGLARFHRFIYAPYEMQALPFLADFVHHSPVASFHLRATHVLRKLRHQRRCLVHPELHRFTLPCAPANSTPL